MHHLIVLAMFLATPAGDSLAPTSATRDPADEIRRLRVETGSLRAQLSAERARTEELRLTIDNLRSQNALFRNDAKERGQHADGLSLRIGELMKADGNKDAMIIQLENERSSANKLWSRRLVYAVGLLGLSLLLVAVPIMRMNKRQGRILASQTALTTELPREFASIRTLITERSLLPPMKSERNVFSERLLNARDKFGVGLRKLAVRVRGCLRRRPVTPTHLPESQGAIITDA